MEESKLDYLMKNSSTSFLIEGSVNGLICLVNEAKELYQWNPTIRKYKKLPDFRTQSSGFIYGFGYDNIHDDYKVVQIYTISRRLRNFQEISVYSLKNDSWQMIDCPQNGARLISSGKFVNGKLHWDTIVGV
ncbi:hypothetical protein HAX54_025603, partial [Datura stramonium]|nr:hypothetical protein [Datura stramonium]